MTTRPQVNKLINYPRRYALALIGPVLVFVSGVLLHYFFIRDDDTDPTVRPSPEPRLEPSLSPEPAPEPSLSPEPAPEPSFQLSSGAEALLPSRIRT